MLFREKGYVYLYIYIYKKHNISVRYKGPRSGVSQSFMYNSTDSVSAAMMPAALHCGSRNEAESPL